MNVSDRTLIRAGRGLAGAAIAIAIVGLLVVVAISREILSGDSGFTIHHAVVAVGLGTIAWLAIPAQPRNGTLWALVISAIAGGVFVVGVAIATVWSRNSDVPDLLLASPSELPFGAAIGIMLTGGTWVATLFTVVAVGLLLFPDGKLLSRRWRWVLWMNIATAAAVTVLLTALTNPGSTQPTVTSGEDYSGVLGVIVAQLFAPLMLGSLLAITSLIIRYRRSSYDVRRQIQWVALGGTLFLIGAVITGPNSGPLPLLVGVAALMAALAVSITKYRLYDINVVVSKAVTYVSLAAVLGLLYGGAVFAYINLLADPRQRASGDLGIALPVGATLLVAISFEPLRRRLQRWADRLVYGDRAEPNQVLTRLTSELAGTASGATLDTLAHLLRDGTAAETAAVWLRVGNKLRAEASSPMASVDPGTERPLEREQVSNDLDLAVPVRRGTELLGLLSITKAANHVVTPADIKLLTDVAASAGLLMHNMRLNAELEERADQLRESRRRLIAAHDSVRHRLERDLHDGAQQQVVALKVKLGLARTIAEREGADDVAVLLEGLAADTDIAVDSMRRVARGIYPPLLETEGLAVALRAGLRSVFESAELDVEDVGRYPREVEQTVYFGVLSAVGEAAAGGATTVQVRVVQEEGRVGFRLGTDAPYGLDLTALADRVEALEGSLVVESEDRRQLVSVTLDVAGVPIGAGVT